MASPESEYQWLDDFESSIEANGKKSDWFSVKEVKKLIRKTRRALKMADEIQATLDEAVRELEAAFVGNKPPDIPRILLKARTKLIHTEGEQLRGNKEADYDKSKN